MDRHDLEARFDALERAQRTTLRIVLGLGILTFAMGLFQLGRPPILVPEARADGVGIYGQGPNAPKLAFTSSPDGQKLYVWKIGDEGWAVGRGYDLAPPKKQ